MQGDMVKTGQGRLDMFWQRKDWQAKRSIDFLEMSHEAIGNVSLCGQQLLF